MIPYVLVAVVVPALFGVSERVLRGPKAKGRLRWMLMSPFELVAVAILVCFAGLRYRIGTDYDIYSYIFVKLDDSNWPRTIAKSPQETGFTVLSLIIKSISDDPHFFFFVMSALTILCTVVGIYLASPSRTISIATFILLAHYTGPMNTVRQGLATSVFFLAFVLYSRWKPGAVALALLACTLHVSAIIALVIFAVARVVKPTRSTMIVMVAASGVGASAIALLPPVQNLLALFGDRYVFYVHNPHGAGIGTVLALVFQLTAAFMLLSIPLSSTFLQWSRNIYLFGPVFTVLGFSFLEATRIAGYFSTVFLILVPYVFEHFKDRPLVRVTMVVAAIGYFVADLLNYGGLLPYQSIFGGV